jgi:hypothetical protein
MNKEGFQESAGIYKDRVNTLIDGLKTARVPMDELYRALPRAKLEGFMALKAEIEGYIEKIKNAQRIAYGSVEGALSEEEIIQLEQEGTEIERKIQTFVANAA